MIQCISEEYVHAAAGIDHDTGYPAVGHLDDDYHGVVKGLDRVIGVIFGEYDVSGAKMTHGSFVDFQNLARFILLRYLSSMVFP